MTKIVETDDLCGIKNALAFLIEREMNKDIDEAYLNEINKDFGTIEKASYARQKVREGYKSLLDGLKNK